jgi:hypothetical protein
METFRKRLRDPYQNGGLMQITSILNNQPYAETIGKPDEPCYLPMHLPRTIEDVKRSKKTPTCLGADRDDTWF